MLVIVGLLIGGILAANSMIGTAKIQGVVRQLQQYDVAVSNFQTKYNQIPGDSTSFSGGNNDGQIDLYESGNFWPHLSQGVGLLNLKKLSYQGFQPFTDTISDLNCPKFNLNQAPGQPCILAHNDDMYANWGIAPK